MADEPGQAVLDRAPFEHYVAAAGLTAKPDVGAEPINQPRVPAAWMAATEADDIAEEQAEDGLVWHRRVRVSKTRMAVRREEAPGRRGELQPIHRRDGDDDVLLGGRELGDDAARSGQ